MRSVLALLLSLTATSAGAFEGSYSGDGGGDGSEQSLVIKKNAKGRYTVRVEVARTGCQGDMTAKGKAKGNTLRVDYNSDGIQCTLTVKKTKSGMTVDEGDCWVMHGTSCQFSGNYKRK